MNLLYMLDLLGTMVFAISGSLTANDKGMDPFGVSAVGFITALGGGTLRDLLIGSTPVAWMNDLSYLTMVALGITLALVFKRIIQDLRRTFFLFDTIGIAVFTVLGLQKAMNIGLNEVVAIMMGMVSAVFGGVIRDIVCNEIPLIFRKEVYAMTCVIGGVMYVVLGYLSAPVEVTMIAAVLIIITLRLLAVKYNWHLPRI